MRYLKFTSSGWMIATLAIAGCGEEPAKNVAKKDKAKGAVADTEKAKTASIETEKPKAASGDAKKEHKHGAGGHHGSGPNGGVIFDLGKYHAEFTVDHGKKECSVQFIAGEDEKAKPLAVAATEFTLTTKETKTKEGNVVAAMTLTLVAKEAKDGKASKFTGTAAGLGNVADFEGTVNGLIDGKPASGDFKE